MNGTQQFSSTFEEVKTILIYWEMSSDSSFLKDFEFTSDSSVLTTEYRLFVSVITINDEETWYSIAI